MATLWQTTWPTEALCSGKLSKAAGGPLKRFVLGSGKTTKRLGLFPPRPGTGNQRSQPKRFGRNKAIRPQRFPSCHCDRRSAVGSNLQSPTGHQKGKRFPLVSQTKNSLSPTFLPAGLSSQPKRFVYFRSDPPAESYRPQRSASTPGRGALRSAGLAGPKRFLLGELEKDSGHPGVGGPLKRFVLATGRTTKRFGLEF